MGLVSQLSKWPINFKLFSSIGELYTQIFSELDEEKREMFQSELNDLKVHTVTFNLESGYVNHKNTK